MSTGSTYASSTQQDAQDQTQTTQDQSSASAIGASSGSSSPTGATASTDPTQKKDTAAATSASDIPMRITEWRLSGADLKADLASGVTIVRSKDSLVGAPTGRADDELIETMIKGKLQADRETAKATIEVEADKGEVSLKGTADSANMIGRAIALALDTEGVTKVSADVKVNARTNN